MKHQIEQVEEWQGYFGRMGHIISDDPITIDEKTAQARVDFITEELEEYLDANKAGDIVGVLDAIVDILYFTFGMIVIHGLQAVVSRGFDIVHGCNMTKLWPNNEVKTNSDGKVLKPDSFEKPERQLRYLFLNFDE